MKNTDIKRISSWMQENKLFPNMSKTEFVIYSSHQRMKRKGNVILSCTRSSYFDGI